MVPSETMKTSFISAQVADHLYHAQISAFSHFSLKKTKQGTVYECKNCYVTSAQEEYKQQLKVREEQVEEAEAQLRNVEWLLQEKVEELRKQVRAASFPFSRLSSPLNTQCRNHSEPQAESAYISFSNY